MNNQQQGPDDLQRLANTTVEVTHLDTTEDGVRFWNIENLEVTAPITQEENQ
ncbi:Uncharacterised protein [Mycobacteroides abscessus subsp. abscessus]|uniref:hypothetical protein n=1 Tax=Mycobacteroides abscessus TaxID=36809 RepID=UPI000925B4E4|nr:hypothetical protein [Mycobacteroides abscessus]SHT00287.1 Uncharacterised protein [Mycobacteroides abscessus subsp. abscessus]SHT24421.1 Uncharacterised protein [Mycobacteroides abscessus subsp. abscessus]SHT62218.1 Uncharacterised protein [Mycobacteroides abscessus subsp. abscessus]SHX78046.1 Uncharacterised protein [Mycobacteroides abscessus subsp. abscessus]SIB42669.1 Uncharacterised protein [Mycobacteroides abscessus subsp. abscessus]